MSIELSGIRVIAIACLVLPLFQGCASLGCEEYMTYDDLLDSWVGSPLTQYEQRNDKGPLSVMERPMNRLEYAYDTPYYQYDGSTLYCRTWLEADRDTGEITGWRHDGDCYMHGRCLR